MKPISLAERREAIKSFDAYDEPELEVVGRSESQAWGTCPAQASLIEAGKEGPKPAYVETGEQVHKALGKAVQAWIDSTGEIGPQGIRDALEQALRGSRPDLQPQVIAAARASIWSFAAFLSEVNPANILNFDGGEGELSGQLAMDLPTAGVRFTGEVDLLWAGPQRGVLQLEDFKSGWKFHRGTAVYESYQFSSYACLILDNYPSIEAVEARVWNTRKGTRTYPVLFERKNLDRYLARIHAALQSRYEHKDSPQAWPTKEKCGMCSVSLHCPHGGIASEVSADPAAAVSRLIVLERQRDELSDALAEYVDKTGKDVVFDKTAFGRNKPKSTRRSPAGIYERADTADEMEEEIDGQT